MILSVILENFASFVYFWPKIREKTVHGAGLSDGVTDVASLLLSPEAETSFSCTSVDLLRLLISSKKEELTFTKCDRDVAMWFKLTVGGGRRRTRF